MAGVGLVWRRLRGGSQTCKPMQKAHVSRHKHYHHTAQGSVASTVLLAQGKPGMPGAMGLACMRLWGTHLRSHP